MEQSIIKPLQIPWRRIFYVDDCLKSVPTSEEGIGQANDLCDMMANGGLKLTKWISNDRKVLQSIPEQLRAKDVKDWIYGKMSYQSKERWE